MASSLDPLAFAKIVAIIKADAESNKATDIYALATALQKDLPSLPRSDIIQLIERSVIALRGSAIWERPANQN